MIYPNRGILQAFFLALMLFFGISAGSTKAVRAQAIEFDGRSGRDVSIPEHTYHRIEHFLSHVFPMRQMRRYTHNSGAVRSRHVAYEVISQSGIDFVLVGYSAQWNEPVNELAIYRLEDGGPNQVWRSRPWEGTAGDLHFHSVAAKDRNVILFQEGGNEGEFGLASVFTFKNAPEGLFLHDLTPELPWLRARAHFPFRTLYGERISMHVQDVASSQNFGIVLTASDEEYNLGMARIIRPARSWKYNSTHNRFERIKSMSSLGEPEATNSR
jgi:hypothetical protein